VIINKVSTFYVRVSACTYHNCALSWQTIKTILLKEMTMCTCWAKQHILYFFAGAAFWNALTHVFVHYAGVLPLTVWGYTITSSNNPVFIGVSAGICLLALLAARTVGNCACCSANDSAKQCKE